VPIEPTVALPEYRAVRKEVTVTEVTDEMLTAAMDDRRERHVVLKPLEEPRPARQGDQLTARVESFVGEESVEGYTEDQEIPESKLILEPNRLAAGLFEPLLGIDIGETREAIVHMSADHANEKVRDQDVRFKVTALTIEERQLPEWDELPMLEEFEGTIDELRTKTLEELTEAAREAAERDAINSYVEDVVGQTSFDIPDAMIKQSAEGLLEEQGEQFERYGITLDQMLQYRGTTREAEIERLLPQAEERLRNSLTMQAIVRAEGLNINSDEIAAEIDRAVSSYQPEQQDLARNMLSNQLLNNVATNVLNRKLRDRLLEIATGTAPELPAPAEESAAQA
jgi:trigger factor